MALRGLMDVSTEINRISMRDRPGEPLLAMKAAIA